MERKEHTIMLVMNTLVVSFIHMNDIHGYEKYDFDEVSEEDKKEESRC